MSYKLEKTKTEKEIIDFKAKYLQDCLGQGYDLTFAEDNNYIYALEANEILQDGEVIINPDYEAEQAERERQINNAEILAQISELEKTQFRAVREIALNKSLEFAMGKLQVLDNQIATLRSQLR